MRMCLLPKQTIPYAKQNDKANKRLRRRESNKRKMMKWKTKKERERKNNCKATEEKKTQQQLNTRCTHDNRWHCEWNRQQQRYLQSACKPSIHRSEGAVKRQCHNEIISRHPNRCESYWLVTSLRCGGKWIMFRISGSTAGWCVCAALYRMLTDSTMCVILEQSNSLMTTAGSTKSNRNKPFRQALLFGFHLNRGFLLSLFLCALRSRAQSSRKFDYWPFSISSFSNNKWQNEFNRAHQASMTIKHGQLIGRWKDFCRTTFSQRKFSTKGFLRDF